MTAWTDHLMIAPVALPLAAAALMLLFNERRGKLKAAISLLTTLALLAIALKLLQLAGRPGADGTATAGIYLLGNWPAPFGIVLVVDRLAAMMLVLTSVLGCTSLLFSLARWHRAGPRFHSLFLLLLMGLNGAFLTGDLFNLFVFFEVLLAASYGLVLHGSGAVRIKAGLHYIAINLTASLLFLIGVSLIYGVTGTLNMADLANRIRDVSADNHMLLEAGAAILAVAFLIKAGMWPLSFWLPTTYAAAGAPIAAIFVIMSKVGVYVVLRLSYLLFGYTAGLTAHFGDEWLLYGGMATIVFGTVGVLSAQTLSRLAGFSILLSSGTLLAAVGTGSQTVLGAALFYLVSSTLAISAFFLLIELVNRGRETDVTALPVFADEYKGGFAEETEEDEIGVIIPATIAMLGGGFILCVLLLAGLPPLSGFIAKFAIMAGVLNAEETISPGFWALVALIILSGLATLVAMTRMGINALWAPTERPLPHVRVVEVVPIAILLGLCMVLTIKGGPAMRYMEATAEWLNTPEDYANAVLSAPRVSKATMGVLP